MVAEGEEVKPGSDAFLQELAPKKLDPRCYVYVERDLYILRSLMNPNLQVT